jgi:hypothetical protein
MSNETSARGSADEDFGEMSCEDIDSLIAGTEQAEKIQNLANTGF